MAYPFFAPKAEARPETRCGGSPVQGPGKRSGGNCWGRRTRMRFSRPQAKERVLAHGLHRRYHTARAKPYIGGSNSIFSSWMAKITTSGERSSPPMVGMTRRAGASTGSVRL
jgi:hypothetical protein